MGSTKCRALNDYENIVDGYKVSFNKGNVYNFVKRVTSDFVLLDNNRFGVVLSKEEFSKNFKIVYEI